MALQLPPELEQRVEDLAQATGREPASVLAELVDTALTDDAALRAEVQAGIAELDRGEGITHEQAMERMRAAASR
jgi:predicted transcriptional regulator